MSWQISFHSHTHHDFNEAYAWYENQQKGLGEKFAVVVKEKLSTIELRPESFGSRSDKRHREVKVDGFPYLIVYRVNNKKKTIFIASVHH